MLQHRAEFDAAVTFEDGGDLRVTGFRLDVPRADVTHPDLAALFLGRLGVVGRVTFGAVRIYAEPVIVLEPAGPPRTRFVELSHVIADGLATYPGLPSPAITAHLTWEQSRSRYAEGTEFSFDRITMLGQTGTYLDAPRHRYVDGADLSGVPLERLADLPAIVVRAPRRVIDAADLDDLAVAGRAVLFHTGHDRRFGTPGYAADAPYLTRAAAGWLVSHGAALVGIDSINVDDFTAAAAGERPVHTLLLAAEIPVVENLTNLGDLPPAGARFTAAPPRIAGFGTFPVRAFAVVPFFEPHDHARSAGWQPTIPEQPRP